MRVRVFDYGRSVAVKNPSSAVKVLDNSASSIAIPDAELARRPSFRHKVDAYSRFGRRLSPQARNRGRF